MFYYKVFIWWNDNTTSEFYINADNCEDAENKVLSGFSGTVRDSIASYYSERGNMQAKYQIGTEFKTRHKNPRLCEITDILRTYNGAGELVSIRYVATHEFCGSINH